MAQIIYCHPRKTPYPYHIFTDLDFWDARRLLTDAPVLVKRNFGREPSGDCFPTQIVGKQLLPGLRDTVERRLAKAVASPPRHLVVQAILLNGVYEFDPSRYYPDRWGESRILHFTYARLPLGQSALNSPHRTVRLSWIEGKVRIEQIRREYKFDPPISTLADSRRRRFAPSCF